MLKACWLWFVILKRYMYVEFSINQAEDRVTWPDLLRSTPKHTREFPRMISCFHVAPIRGWPRNPCWPQSADSSTTRFSCVAIFLSQTLWTSTLTQGGAGCLKNFSALQVQLWDHLFLQTILAFLFSRMHADYDSQVFFAKKWTVFQVKILTLNKNLSHLCKH